MPTGHTYYLAYRDRTLGERSADETLASILAETWRSLAAGTEPGVVDGVSAWLDDAGAVQMRLVKGAVAAPIQDAALAEKIAPHLRS